jgi:hypothetical protein
LVIFKRKEGKAVETISIFVQGMELVGKKEGAVALKEEDLYANFWDRHYN